MIKGVLLDISGVLTEGTLALPGAVEVVARLSAAGLPLRFLTNTTRRPKRRLIADLHTVGIEVAPDEVFTPVAAVRHWLEENGYRPHLLIHPDLDEDFADCARSGPVAVVFGDAARGFTYDAMNEAFRLLRHGAPFLALAANRVFRDSDGELSLDAGPFVKALEFASDTEAKLFGKPAAGFFEASAASMGCAPADTVMVGDDAESDIAGALAAGVGAGLLVRTGKYRDRDEAHVSPPPTAVVADIAEATDWILDRQTR